MTFVCANDNNTSEITTIDENMHNEDEICNCNTLNIVEATDVEDTLRYNEKIDNIKSEMNNKNIVNEDNNKNYISNNEPELNNLGNTNIVNERYNITIKEAYHGDTEIIKVRFPSGWNVGALHFDVYRCYSINKLENVHYKDTNQMEVTITGHEALIKVFNIIGGENTLNIHYKLNGWDYDDYYDFQVKKYDLTGVFNLPSEVSALCEFNINGYVNDDVEVDYLTVHYLDVEDKTIELNHGTFNKTLKTNTAGLKELKFYYEGDDKYKSGYVGSAMLNVIPLETEIIIDDIDTTYGMNINLTPKIKVKPGLPKLTGKIEVIEYWETTPGYQKFLKNLNVDYKKVVYYYFDEFIVSNLTAYTHSIRYIYSGDSYFAPCQKNITVKISKSKRPLICLVESEYIIYEDGSVGNNLFLTYKFNDTQKPKYLNQGEIFLTLYGNGEVIKLHSYMSNGVASPYDYNLKTGNYTCVVNYTGDDNHEPQKFTHYAIVKTLLKPENIIPEITNINEHNNSVLIYLPNDASGRISLNISNNEYLFDTIDDGIIKILFPKLSDGKYNYTIFYSGDTYYHPFIKKGQLYVSNTNNNNNNNNPIKEENKLTSFNHSKNSVKIIAKGKTFKKSVKIKKYTITLKTNQNKPMKRVKVTIKINKKTYIAKTNAKGVATFKIKKLTKKGTFKATVTYKGDKYYNKVTKTVKIKIK